MQITVFGASGKIGRLVVSQLLDKGYSVVAFVYSKSNFENNDNLKVIKGDVHSQQDVEKAIQGSEIVISTLGSWHTKSKDILTSAMRSIIPAMGKQDIRRIISLTGSDAHAPGDRPNLLAKLMRPVLQVSAGKILADGEEHIKLLSNSDLNWAVVRSPVMRNFGASKAFDLSLRPTNIWETVNRQHVALAICSLVEDSGFEKSAPFVR